MLFALPILSGLVHVLHASFGRLAVGGSTDWSLEPWRRLFAVPGFARSYVLTVWVGFASTLMSLILAASVVSALHDRLSARGWARVLSPLLAAPHAALAIGLAFLIAPSGWIARLLSPWATGWEVPPDLPLPGDRWGLSLILGLVLKETPFLILMMLAALANLPVRQHLAAGRALGHQPASVWLRVILPELYPLIRMPVLVVLSFGLSVVDMALILGPSTPPTLPVGMTRLFFAADLSALLPGSAAAVLIAATVALSVALWLAGERAVRRAGLAVIRRGPPAQSLPAVPALAAVAGGLAALAFAALIVLVIWSLAFRWPFPADLPQAWTLRAWAGGGWAGPALATLSIGIAATVVSLVLAVLWLEAAERIGIGGRGPEAVVYLPLLVPQIAFLPGLYALLLRHGIPAGWATVVWAHCLFVFPYVMIALADPWRRLDPRLMRQAAALGAGPWRRLWRVRLPLMTAPILTAAAVGFAVSVAQYLPTLFAGAGRLATLTTEAVTLSSGSDRRVTAVYAALQALMPLAAYALAVVLPPLIRGRRLGAA